MMARTSDFCCNWVNFCKNCDYEQDVVCRGMRHALVDPGALVE